VTADPPGTRRAQKPCGAPLTGRKRFHREKKQTDIQILSSDTANQISEIINTMLQNLAENE